MKFETHNITQSKLVSIHEVNDAEDVLSQRKEWTSDGASYQLSHRELPVQSKQAVNAMCLMLCDQVKLQRNFHI